MANKTKGNYQLPFSEEALINELNEHNSHADELTALLPDELMDQPISYEDAVTELASLRFAKGSKAVIFRFVLLSNSRYKANANHNGKPYMWSVSFANVTKAGKACYYLGYDGAVFDSGRKVGSSIQHYYSSPETHSSLDLIQGGYGIGEEVHIPLESITADKPISYWSELVKLVLIDNYQYRADNKWLPVSLESITIPLLADAPEELTIEQWNQNRIELLSENFKDSLVCL